LAGTEEEREVNGWRIHGTRALTLLTKAGAAFLVFSLIGVCANCQDWQGGRQGSDQWPGFVWTVAIGFTVVTLLALWAVVQVIILRGKIAPRGEQARDGGSPNDSRRFAFDEILICNFVDAYNQYKHRKALEPGAKIKEFQDIPALREDIKELKKRFDRLSQAVFTVPSGTPGSVYVEEQSQKSESTIDHIGSLGGSQSRRDLPPSRDRGSIANAPSLSEGRAPAGGRTDQSFTDASQGLSNSASFDPGYEDPIDQFTGARLGEPVVSTRIDRPLVYFALPPEEDGSLGELKERQDWETLYRLTLDGPPETASTATIELCTTSDRIPAALQAPNRYLSPVCTYSANPAKGAVGIKVVSPGKVERKPPEQRWRIRDKIQIEFW
jgi:hypothetical protein